MLASKIRINLGEMGHDSVVVVGGQRVVSGQGHHRLHHRIIVEYITSKDIHIGQGYIGGVWPEIWVSPLEP